MFLKTHPNTPIIATDEHGLKKIFCCLKIKNIGGRLGSLVLICEILWLLFGVWCA